MKKKQKVSAIDLFCGIGGLSYGLKKSGIKVKAGIDQDKSCQFSYEENVKADFIREDISEIKGSTISRKYWEKGEIKILVGCAPCQPFSTHSNKVKDKEKGVKWNLIMEFKRLIEEIKPQIISMENVTNLGNKSIFDDFVNFLKESKYKVSYQNVYCPNYGIPQKRKRLILLASKYGEIKLIDKTHTKENYKTTRDAIGDLEPIESGQVLKSDPLHKTTKLSEINLKRIRASKPKGSWMDWDEDLRLECHKKKTGGTYKSVYGRMDWDEPSPTITTQFYNYGTGRFGHPEQDRALTIREASILQTFPKDYKFYQNETEIYFTKLGVHIGNAVPVHLGYVIGKSIKKHLKTMNKL